MKKIMFFVLAILIFLFQISVSPVKADVGPKPSVVIDIKGLEEGNYYMTLLSKNESTGPYSVGKDEKKFELEDEEAKSYRKFYSLKEKDGYYFLDYMEFLTGEDRFEWSYYPPRDFKLCIYIPDRDLILISKKLEAYAFDSYFVADFRNLALDAKEDVHYFSDQEVEIYKSYDYTSEIISFLARVLLTIAVEIALAHIMFRPSPYQKRLIVKTNIFTQLILNIILNFILFKGGFLAFFLVFILAELIVLIVESIIYKLNLNKEVKVGEKKAPAILYAILANILSAVLGFYIAFYFEFLF